MKTSEKIYNQKNFTPVKGMFGAPSGYSGEEVEAFLEDIVTDVEDLEKENENLRLQVKNLLEERQIENKVYSEEEQEELTEMKEKLKRKLEQLETIERANKKLFYKAEEVYHDTIKEAETNALEIVDAAKEQANSLLKRVEERCVEKENEIKRLESQEKELRGKLADVVKLVQTAVSK